MITLPVLSLFVLTQGGRSCHVPLARALFSPQTLTSNSNRSFVPVRHPNPWPFAAALFCWLPPITRPTSNWPNGWIAIGTPSASGVNASSLKASPASKTRPAPADPGAFPPDEHLHVLHFASSPN